MLKPRLFVICLFATIAVQHSVQATIKTWNNASGGTWFEPGSWTPSGVPGTSDTASITLSGTYTVTIDSQRVKIARLVLGASDGIQTVQIAAPADSLVLTRNSVIYGNGRLNSGRAVVALMPPIASNRTLAISGGFTINSAGRFYFTSLCTLAVQNGGTVSLADTSDINSEFLSGTFRGIVSNSGSFTKTGTGLGTLYCDYHQASTGTFALQGGSLAVWDFRTNGLVTLSSGTNTTVNCTSSRNLYIDSLGVVDIQGTATIDGCGDVRNHGLFKHTLVGTSTVTCNYTDNGGSFDGHLQVLAGKLYLTQPYSLIDHLLEIGPSAELEVYNADFTGGVESIVADSGTLTVNSPPTQYITYVSGSFTFSGNLHIIGGEVEFSPSTNPVTLHSLTVDSAATFMSLVTIQTSILNMYGGTTDANIVVADQYDWTAGTYVGNPGTDVTIGTGVSLDVYGQAIKHLDTRDLYINGSASLSGSGQFALAGGASIIVNSAGTLTIGDSIAITGTVDSLINHGQLIFDCPNDTAIISAFLYNIPTTRTPGTIEILSGKVEFESASNFGSVEMVNGAELTIKVQWINSGLLIMDNGSQCKVVGILQNEPSGVIHMHGSAEITGSGSVSNAGLIDYTGGGQRSTTNTVIGAVFSNLAAAGCLEIVSDTLALTNGGSNAGDIFIHSGSMLRILETFVNEASGTIRGGGTLDISGASFTNNGAINPGSSPGTLRIIGGLNTQGTINIESAGLGQGTEYDRLLVNGGVAFGGTLHLSLLNGFTPTLTDTFRCITYTGRSGEFAAVTGTPVGNGTFMEIAYRPTEIVQYVCSGISDISVSDAAITDSVHWHREDTLGLIICNQGHCPLEWTTDFGPFNPGYPNDCPTWEGVGSGGSGLITRGQCVPLRVAVNAWCLPGTYTSQIRISSNDPDEPLTVIPVQVVVPSIFDINRNVDMQPDFLSIGAAVGFLIDEGVFEPTLFNVYPDTGYGNATIPAITGASAANTITFRCDSGAAGMRCNDAPALILDEADHIVFDHIGFKNYGTGGTYPYAVWLKNGADSNIIRSAYVTGAGLTGSNSGIYMDGAGNNANVFEADTIVNSYYAFYLSSSSTSCIGNEIRDCYIPECVRGVYLYRQSAKVHGNDIQPGYSGATPAVYGVYFSVQAANDTTVIYGNRIHNFRGTTNAVGINVSPTSAGVVRIFNNFIYDWQNTGGTVTGIAASGAVRVECDFNSIRINDVTASSTIAALSILFSSAQLSMSNNILEIDEPTSSCWSIYRTNGTLTSNYNCFYGTGYGYYVGRYGTTDYSTLSNWRTGTGNDLQSKQGDPGFLGAADLHIDPFACFIDSAGTPVAGITADFDGDARANVPDIGADEYTANHNRVDDLVIHASTATNSVILTWGSVMGAQCYRIYRSDPATSSIYPSVLVASVTDTTYTHTGILSSAAHLFYHVAASSTSP
jgi:hypothetical protein